MQKLSASTWRRMFSTALEPACSLLGPGALPGRGPVGGALGRVAVERLREQVQNLE